MAKKKKEFNEEVLNRVFNNGRCVNYRYPDELSTLIKDIDVEERICKYKRRSGIEIYGYYAVFVDSHSGPYIRLLHVTGYEEKYGYYTGDMIVSSDISLSLSHDEIFEIDYYETVKEITREVFDRYASVIEEMEGITDTLSSYTVKANIDKGVWRAYKTFHLNKGIIYIHNSVSDMTIQEFIDKTEEYNAETMRKLKEMSDYCVNMYGKYFMWNGERGTVHISKVENVRTEDYFVARGFVWYLETDCRTMSIVNTNEDGKHMYNIRKDSKTRMFLSGKREYYILPNVVGDALFNRYDSVTSGLRSLFSNKTSDDDKKGGISYDK